MPDLPERRYGERGRKPTLVHTKDGKEAAERICRWATNPAHQDEQAAVFFWRTKHIEVFLKEIGKINPLIGDSPVKVQKSYFGGRGGPDELNWDDPGIKLLTYSGNKGTEFEAVFMPELQKIYGPLSDPSRKETKQTFYVAITRARNELSVMYSGSGEPKLLSLFRKDQFDGPDAPTI